jgi:hypothetical protein
VPARKLGWKGDPWDFYFFVRDRKGLIANFLPPLSVALLGLLVFGYIDLTDCRRVSSRSSRFRSGSI